MVCPPCQGRFSPDCGPRLLVKPAGLGAARLISEARASKHDMHAVSSSVCIHYETRTLSPLPEAMLLRSPLPILYGERARVRGGLRQAVRCNHARQRHPGASRTLACEKESAGTQVTSM